VNSVSVFIRKNLIILVFLMGCIVRAIPDMMARPYPIGYDVINYYIPVITNFQEHWSAVSKQFPLYVLILHFFQISTNLQPQTLVIVSAVILYGFFSVSLFLMSRWLFGLSEAHSLYLTLFVIFQLPVLRTAWDLHKDVFSLTLLLVSVSLIFPLRAKIGSYTIIGSSIAALVAVSLDKMVGALFVASLTIYGIISRTKYASLLSLLILGFFAVAIASDYDNIRQSLQTLSESAESNLSDRRLEPYSPTSLLMLFIVVNGPLLVPGGFGFMQANNRLLKIAIGITAVGSFSWIFFPDLQSLAADRWIFLFGIFLSIFAGYGIIKYSQTRLHPRLRSRLLCIILGFSISLGLIYETMPYRFASFPESIVGQSIEPFGPATMQFNSLTVKDTDELLKSIAWINENTPTNATIVGEKHWRGWMEIKLQDDRKYSYNSNRYEVIQSNQNCHLHYCFLLTHSSDSLDYLNERVRKHVYHSNLFTLYEIRSIVGTR
jgi:hypothetical protein